ncbi:COX assembly mitochondrial protein [Aphelenchoides besseyi]|nr:COX assembly mitochondrial protein [Aphelenchoides besseyi]KAI6232409.1 COX assembly mitochondrial protein [Aphelenchoides besseyi]
MLFRFGRCSNLSSEELRKLKEGEIVTGEDGKKYRVRKTILRKEAITGPCGIGDPQDRSLRKIEAEVLIPNMMNKEVEKIECRSQFEGLVACMRREGGAVGLRTCTDVLEVFNKCKKEKFEDPEFRQQITNAYLDERSDVRRTGMSAKERKLKEYREWKEQQTPKQ